MIFNHPYDDLAGNLSKLFFHEIEKFKVVYNFDSGDEFEIAICSILRGFLPHKYGICRGFVTDYKGNTAGDDIIIFDQLLFPKLGLRFDYEFSRKEFIPIEAVLVYIEAKKTLNFKDDSKTEYEKALSQIFKVKTLINNRAPVAFQETEILKYDEKIIPFSDTYPRIRNSAVVGVFASNINVGFKVILKDEIAKEFSLNYEHFDVNKIADFLILGKDNLSLPVFNNFSEGVDRHSYFSIKNDRYQTILKTEFFEDRAFGLGILQILGLLPRLLLKPIPTDQIIIDYINQNKKYKKGMV